MLSLVSAETQRGSPGARPPRPASPRATPGQPPGHRSFQGSKSTTDRGKTAHCLQAATKRKTLAQDQEHHSQDRATRAVVAQSTTAKRLGRKAEVQEAPGSRRQKNRVERHTGSDTTAPGPNVTPRRRRQTKDRPATSRPPAGHSRPQQATAGAEPHPRRSRRGRAGPCEAQGTVTKPGPVSRKRTGWRRGLHFPGPTPPPAGEGSCVFPAVRMNCAPPGTREGSGEVTCAPGPGPGCEPQF